MVSMRGNDGLNNAGPGGGSEFGDRVPAGVTVLYFVVFDAAFLIGIVLFLIFDIRVLLEGESLNMSRLIIQDKKIHHFFDF